MIAHELKMNAVKTVMLLLRSMGPNTQGEMRRELLIQCEGVDKSNVDAVLFAVLAFTTDERHPMIEPYDDVKGAWTVAERMYDQYGNYKGEE